MRIVCEARETPKKLKRKIPKVCPRCDSPNLMHFEKEIMCCFCSWDSIALNAEAYFEKRHETRSDVNQFHHSRGEPAAEFSQELFTELSFYGAELALI